MENEEQIFLTMLIIMGIELGHELGFAAFWLHVLRGNKSLHKIPKWWGRGKLPQIKIDLATYLTNTRTGNCTYANNYIIIYTPDHSSFLAIKKWGECYCQTK